jgi:hypothetical protein
MISSYIFRFANGFSKNPLLTEPAFFKDLFVMLYCIREKYRYESDDVMFSNPERVNQRDGFGDNAFIQKGL